MASLGGKPPAGEARVTRGKARELQAQSEPAIRRTSPFGKNLIQGKGPLHPGFFWQTSSESSLGRGKADNLGDQTEVQQKMPRGLRSDKARSGKGGRGGKGDKKKGGSQDAADMGGAAQEQSLPREEPPPAESGVQAGVSEKPPGGSVGGETSGKPQDGSRGGETSEKPPGGSGVAETSVKPSAKAKDGKQTEKSQVVPPAQTSVGGEGPSGSAGPSAQGTDVEFPIPVLWQNWEAEKVR